MPHRHFAIAAIVAAVAVWAAGCSTLTPAGPSNRAQAAADRGHTFVLRACAGCHAVEPGMESPNHHAPTFRDLAQLRTDAELAAALSAISRNGHVEMPPIYITPAEQGDVVAYLRSLTARPI